MTLRIIVEGKVQGVFFRKNTKRKATELGIKGTVKNLKDGRVEIYAKDSEDKLKELVNWCHEGPEQANVNNVEIEEIDDEISFDGFEVVG